MLVDYLHSNVDTWMFLFFLQRSRRGAVAAWAGEADLSGREKAERRTQGRCCCFGVPVFHRLLGTESHNASGFIAVRGDGGCR